MYWKVKAFIQNFVASLPNALSYETYCQIQRHFGNLKKPLSPLVDFSTGVSILKKTQTYGNGITGKTFFEVGTGRVPLVPVALWLGGADQIITIDLNPYMRNELITDMLFYIRTKTEEVKKLFGDFMQEERFRQLLEYSKLKKADKTDFLKMCRIKYIAPGDAAKTKLDNGSVHYHISNTVYEHIPLNIIKDILEEGNRITTTDALFINNIDYGDHFSYMDKNISVINFLRYNDREWDKYAGNRYMYMNRARHDDFVKLFRSVGHEFIETTPCKSKEAEEILKRGEIAVDEKFKERGNDILSITGACFITKKL